MALGTPAHGVGNCRTLRLREAWDPVLSDHLERPCLSNEMIRVSFQCPCSASVGSAEPRPGAGRAAGSLCLQCCRVSHSF